MNELFNACINNFVEHEESEGGYERNRYFPIFYSIIWDEGKVQWRTENTLHVSETC